MYAKRATIGLLIFALAGCTSFRTTALYRMDNDSVTPECPNKKLRGLPVKLKVPSHVRVSIYEQQVILANGPDQVTNAVAQANADAQEVTKLQARIDGAQPKLNQAKKARDSAQQFVTEYGADVVAAGADVAKKTAAEALLKDAAASLVIATNAVKAAQKELDSVPTLLENLRDATAVADLSAKNAAIGYALISFSPPQLYVDSNLEYTDKVFLVDFRRPAGGVLNLTEASMDDEQYFSKIQADVTEQTLKDVGNALDTLKGPLTPPKKPATNKASPTSANSTGNENSDQVNFQKSIVASRRFDISEPDWEMRMMDFVNLHLGCGTVNEIENGLLMPSPAK